MLMMSRRRLGTVAAAIAITTAGFIGSGAQAQQKPVIKVSSLTLPVFNPLVWNIMKARGLDAKHGFELDIHAYPSISAFYAGFATGETDVQRPQMSIAGDKLVLNDGTREVDFLHFGWGHTRGDGYVWLPKEKVLATGDAAVNGPRNKLLDAYLENWPKALEQAIALGPVHVLPGHGDAGGAR